MKKMIDMLSAFGRDEDGIALTEYLILLGLLTAGVIVSVLAIGGNLNTAWAGWASWFATNTGKLDGPA